MTTYNWNTGVLGGRDFRKLSSARFQLSPEVKKLFDSGEPEKVEELFLEHVDASPGDLAWFVPIIRSFVKKNDIDRASVLLNFLFDMLNERKDRSSQTELSILLLEFWPGNKVLCDYLLERICEIYPASPRYKMLAAFCKVNESPEPLIALHQLELWLRYDEGRPVYMAGRGVGNVKEINPQLDTVRAIFEGYGQISFKLDEAERLLEPLPPDHFLSEKISNPGALRKLSEDNLSGLLERLFSSIKKQLTLSELKEMLAGIVDENQWTAWWSRARKDRRITVGKGAKPDITWSGSSDEAELRIAEQFKAAPIKEKLDLAKRYGSRSAALSQMMSDGLARESLALESTDPSIALDVALTIENMREGGPAVEMIDRLLKREDISAIILGIDDKPARKRMLAEARNKLDKWPSVYLRIMTSETDGTLLETMYDLLNKEGHAEQLERFAAQVLSSPSDAPRFYAWLCREMDSRPELARRADLPFLIQLVSAIGVDSLRAQQASLRKLFDPGGPADNIIAALDLAGSKRFSAFLDRDSNLESYRKDRIKRILNEKFPEMQEHKDTHLYVTAESLEKKRLEFEKLVKSDIPHNALEIKRTREYGDLRENFEYHAARARQELLSSRAKTLHDELANARIIDFKTLDTSSVQVGARVILRSADEGAGKEIVMVLGPWDSDPDKHIISYTSQAGNALLGARPGSRISYNEKEYIIDKIESAM